LEELSDHLHVDSWTPIRSLSVEYAEGVFMTDYQVDIKMVLLEPSSSRNKESIDQIVVDQDAGSGDEDRVEFIGAGVRHQRFECSDRTASLGIQQMFDLSVHSRGLFIVGHDDGPNCVSQCDLLGVQDFDDRGRLVVGIGHDPPHR